MWFAAPEVTKTKRIQDGLTTLHSLTTLWPTSYYTTMKRATTTQLEGTAFKRVVTTHNGAHLGRGGLGLDPLKTAVLLIEVQNEFMTPGGKLHESVRPVMEEVNMLPNCVKLVTQLRKLGAVKLMYAPISFAPGGTDNPNRHLGILAGCDYDELFIRGSWNAAIAEPMWDPTDPTVLIEGKRGLSAFVDTDLAEKLKQLNIDTIALGGFMANCCVESTMRDAFDRGFNVITLTDCVATTTIRGYKSCVEITYPFFSTPMNCDSFLASLRTAMKLSDSYRVHSLKGESLQLNVPSWACRRFAHSSGNANMETVHGVAADALFQLGPWAVDVRKSAICEKVVLRSGEHELKRYLAMAEGTGAFGSSSYWEQGCDCIYSDKLKRLQTQTVDIHGSEEAFGWFCHMVVVRLPAGGCLVYSPVLGPDSEVSSVHSLLREQGLLPVRLVLVPTPQHHLALAEYQREFPDALYMCGHASGQMQSLTKKRRDLRFDGSLRATGPQKVCDGVFNPTCDESDMQTIVDPSPIPLSSLHPQGGGHQELVTLWSSLVGTSGVFVACILDDNRTGEIVLLHKPSKTLIVSDMLYKSCPDIVGPGGVHHHYSWPEWFAQGQEELFYDERCSVEGMQSNTEEPAKKPLLPSYRTHPKARTIDVVGLRRSLELILAWDFTRCLTCHTDPIDGEEARRLIRQAWGWVWDC